MSQTVEHFWRVYDHVSRPAAINTTGQTTFHLFKQGIKPTWEDPNNCRGGAWIVRLRKGLAARFWEELLLAMIGEQLDAGNEICGAKLSVRYNEDIISLWNRNADNLDANGKIRDQMRRAMRLPQYISMEYKRHEVSITDKSSFRNTMVWRTGDGRDDGGHGGGPAQQQAAPPLPQQQQAHAPQQAAPWGAPGGKGGRHGATGSAQGFDFGGGSGGDGRWGGGSGGLAGGKGAAGKGGLRGSGEWGASKEGPPPVRDLNAKWR